MESKEKRMSSISELEEYFIFKSEKGLEQRGLADKKEYKDRLKYEIEVILKMGFCGYFLIVQDFINWAKKNNIYVGPGRGSAAGSLVAYSLGITNLDPIKLDLLFERFLNPGRMGAPIINIEELSFKDFKNNILPSIDSDLDISYI
jgi:DNA polymerase-3 subunit alpha